MRKRVSVNERQLLCIGAGALYSTNMLTKIWNASDNINTIPPFGEHLTATMVKQENKSNETKYITFFHTLV